MKKIIATIATVCFSLISLSFSSVSISAENVISLRGSVDLDEISEMIPNRRVMAVNEGIDVTFEDQPPMIPHSIDKTRITLNENSCLACHNRKDAKIEDSPPPPKSHYKTREGDKLKKISTGRYFCTQCHMSQDNAKPLVENTFVDNMDTEE